MEQIHTESPDKGYRRIKDSGKGVSFTTKYGNAPFLMNVGLFGLMIGNQSILIGLCYANGLSPISGTYGFGYGILAGGLHYLLVTAVPDMHGGFCLYNGGFTAALICLMLVPQLEKFCKTKEERKLAKVK